MTAGQRFNAMQELRSRELFVNATLALFQVTSYRS